MLPALGLKDWRIRRVGVLQNQLVQAARVEIGERDGSYRAKLTLEADGSLHGVGRAQVGIDLVDGGGGIGKRAAGKRNVAGRIGRAGIDHSGVYGLRLGDSVHALGLQDQILGKAVIEDSVANAQHGLRSALGAAQAPGETEAGSKVCLVVDGTLALKAQAVAQREVRAQLPIVLGIESDVCKGKLRRVDFPGPPNNCEGVPAWWIGVRRVSSKVKVPLKLLLASLESCDARRRPPNFTKCLPAAHEV